MLLSTTLHSTFNQLLFREFDIAHQPANDVSLGLSWARYDLVTPIKLHITYHVVRKVCF